MSEAAEFSEDNLLTVLKVSHKEPTKISGVLERFFGGIIGGTENRSLFALSLTGFLLFAPNFFLHCFSNDIEAAKWIIRFPEHSETIIRVWRNYLWNGTFFQHIFSP